MLNKTQLIFQSIGAVVLASLLTFSTNLSANPEIQLDKSEARRGGGGGHHPGHVQRAHR